MLAKAEDMRTFLRLVEANSTVKQYRKALGFEGGDVRVHIKFVKYYAKYIEMSEEISILSKKKKDATPLERTRIQVEILKTRTRYRDILSKLKAEHEV